MAADSPYLFQEVVGCGTEDELTCHVNIMREPSLGVNAIGHFDELSRVWDFEGLMNDFLAKVKLMKERKDYDYWDGDGDEEDWEWEIEEEDDTEEQVQLDPDMNNYL